MANFTLNPLILPETSSVRRRHIVPDKYRLDEYDETYDFHTIAYDVIWIESKKSLLFICPKLLNLERLFKQANITASGNKLSNSRIKRYRRHDEVWMACDQRPNSVEIVFDDFTLSTKISVQEHAFDGKNVLMTKSKDNELVWISDWIRHHVQNQSANSVLIFDNGSETYPLSDLQQTTQSVDGIDVAAAVASDFPFGSWKATKLLHRSMFFQAGMLSIARHRFLHCANAVLPIDIDELVCGDNVFEAARKSRFGYVTIPSAWRYSKLAPDQMPRHADHVWRRDPDATCKEKYCLAPERWFTDTVWDIHGLHRYVFNGLAKLKTAQILHCEHVSNGWKRKRDAAQNEPLVRDAQTEEYLKHLR